MDSGGYSGLTLSTALKSRGKPVTRVENMCASGSESLRGAVYAVASGAYDVVMATGVEKLKDSGFSGLVRNDPPDDGTSVETTAPAAFSYLAPAYEQAYDVDPTMMRKTLSHIAVKNHANGALNPRAQFRTPVTAEAVSRSPLVAGSLGGVLDCSGVADGAAAALVVRAEDAYKYTDTPMFVKALSVVAGNGYSILDDDASFASVPEVVTCAADAYRQAGITTHGEKSRSPKSTTASPRLSSCSWKISDSPNEDTDGSTSSTVSSTRTAPCRSTSTEDSSRSDTRSERRACE